MTVPLSRRLIDQAINGPFSQKIAGSRLKCQLYSALDKGQFSPLNNFGLAMNLFRLFQDIPQQAARACSGRSAHSKAIAIETLRRFQDGKLNERDSEAVIDALLRFNEGSLTEEELVDIAGAIGQKL